MLRVFQERSAAAPELLGPATANRVEIAFAAGGWTFGAEGLTAGSATVSLVLEDGQVEVCRDEVVITVVVVTTVEWDEFAVYSTPLGRPCPNNNDARMFPGKRYVVDTFRNDRNKVALQATVSPVVQGFPVQFRVWDVDDPFDQNNPGMVGVTVIDSDASGPDNRLPGGGPDPAVGNWSADTDENGVARITVEVSMQPGNNYRAAASIMSDGLTDANITQALVDANTPPPQALLTEMLTVWRHVWLELDSMAAGTDISYTGAIDAINNNQPHTGDGTVELDVPDINDDGRFEGGAMTVAGTGNVYTIIDNVDRFVDDDYTMSTLVAAADLDQMATAVDDDTAVLPKTPDANITVLNNKYRNCYLDFTENSATRDVNNGFVAALPDAVDTVVAKGLENADLTPAEDFWLIIIVTGYQSHKGSSSGNASIGDADPDKQYHTHGVTFSNGDTALGFARVPEVGAQNIVIVFLETDLDYVVQAANGFWSDWGHIPRPITFMEPRLIVHEIGHVFGLTHANAAYTIMDGWTGLDNDMSAEQINIVRSSPLLSSH